MDEVLIRVVDLETTGMEPPAEVLELGWTDALYNPKTKATRIEQAFSNILFRPLNGIPAESSAVHHITMSRVADLPVFEPVDALTVFAGAFAVAAHNDRFERQWLKPIEGYPEPHWICSYKCALRAWVDFPAHSNQALRYLLGYEDIPENLSQPAHRAGPDSYVTAIILAELLKTHSVNTLVQWTKMPRFYATCPLTKYKGRPWSDVDKGYLNWIVDKPNDLDEDIRAAARDELDRRRNPQ